MQLETEEYMTIERVNAVRERAGKLRRQFLKYKDAEIVYSLTHRSLIWVDLSSADLLMRSLRSLL